MLGIRPDVIEFRQRAHLSFKMARDQFFHISRFHAGEKGGYYDFTDNDRRVFLAWKVKKLSETAYDDGKNDHHRQS
jgi:hypothetical protein